MPRSGSLMRRTCGARLPMVAMALVRRIRDSGVAIIMVEHLVKALFGVSDRVAVLSAGEKISEGTPEQVAQDRRVIDAYLGTGSADAAEAIALA